MATYCRLDGISSGVTDEVVDALRSKMQEIIAADLPYHRITCPTEDAVRLFRENGQESKAELLES